MLAVSPLRNNKKDEGEISEMESWEADFVDFSSSSSGGNLLDTIDFDDLFIGINDGDVLPDLEMDSSTAEINLAEFSLSGGEDSEIINSSASLDNNNNYYYNYNNYDNNKVEENIKYYNNNNNNSGISRKDEVDKNSSGSLSSSSSEDVVSKPSDQSVDKNGNGHSSPKKEAEKDKKSSSNNQAKNAQGKRKVKVDWTPDLHRRFVQAVEQLGVDKAVPSRILELMGIDCLTRHNIASHLQKYRSHRKHLLAREAEAASWNQRRQMYGAGAVAPPPATVGGKRDMNPWAAPTIGFPPVAPMPHFRPLHVWGHPSVDQSLMHTWPKHGSASPSPPPPPTWPPYPPHQPPLTDPSFWHSHHQRAPNSLTPGTPCFAPPMAAARFPAPPAPGIPPSTIGVPTNPVGQTLPKPPADFQPSKESIDAAIGDVLSQPWLPLPLGLKQPSVDSVLGELQRQGISKVPPPCV